MVIAGGAVASGAIAGLPVTIGGGPVTHASTGALTSGSATVTGSSARIAKHAASGVLSAQSAVVTGTSAHVAVHGSTGSLAAQSATIAGTALHNIVHLSTGTIIAGYSSIVGTGLNGEASATTQQGGGGHWVIKKREKVRRLDEIVEQGVREAYQEITGTAPKKIQKEAAKLVRPYIEKGVKPESIPDAEKIDWEAMQRDARRVQAMLDLWQEQAMAERLMAQNDEDVLLLLAM